MSVLFILVFCGLLSVTVTVADDPFRVEEAINLENDDVMMSANAFPVNGSVPGRPLGNINSTPPTTSTVATTSTPTRPASTTRPSFTGNNRNNDTGGGFNRFQNERPTGQSSTGRPTLDPGSIRDLLRPNNGDTRSPWNGIVSQENLRPPPSGASQPFSNFGGYNRPQGNEIGGYNPPSTYKGGFTMPPNIQMQQSGYTLQNHGPPYDSPPSHYNRPQQPNRDRPSGQPFLSNMFSQFWN